MSGNAVPLEQRVRPKSQQNRRIREDHGSSQKPPIMDRTQEVAGSSPASSMKPPQIGGFYLDASEQRDIQAIGRDDTQRTPADEAHGSVTWDEDPGWVVEAAREQRESYRWLKLYAGRGEADRDLDRLQRGTHK
jgi:hypothetical protein